MSAQLNTNLHRLPAEGPTLKGKVSESEWETRVNLAACYRLAAHYRMTDLIFTHISARIPGADEHFLINPYGLMFDEITASSLVEVDIDGAILQDTTGLGINMAGYVIHSAIHRARHDVHCVMHTHTRAGAAVSAQKNGLLPISQHAMRFYNQVAYHSYEGVALDMDEQTRLVRDLGDKNVMILRNHGLLTAGAAAREAFELMYYLEMSCQIQVDAMAGGAELNIPTGAVCEKVVAQFNRPSREGKTKDWPALLRMLDRNDSSFRN